MVITGFIVRITNEEKIEDKIIQRILIHKNYVLFYDLDNRSYEWKWSQYGEMLEEYISKLQFVNDFLKVYIVNPTDTTNHLYSDIIEPFLTKGRGYDRQDYGADPDSKMTLYIFKKKENV